MQAFELEVRPALDSLESALDRVKVAVYVQCAHWGVPCPITGHPSHADAPSESGA